MKIFGSIGRIGSGKDEVVNYLNRRYGVPSVSVGDIVREMASDAGLPTTRENLHHVSSERMRKCGKEYFMDLVLRLIRKERWTKASITGIRTPEDVRFLRRQLGEDFILFRVNVEDPRIRYERIRRRGSQRDPETYDDFLKQDVEEEALFHIDEASSMADYSLDNSGPLENLYKQIEENMNNLNLESKFCRCEGCVGD